MRHRWAVIAGLGILLAGASGWAQEEEPSAPGVVILSERSAQPAPMILRGRPATPAAVTGAPSEARWELLGGKRLWLVDRTSGAVRSCINRDTSTVGLRVIACTSGELGRYSRTFGAAFNP